LALGGLWSRRLGPHREIWSWDVVEITAVDLLGSELMSDHAWQRRPASLGSTWGGGEVRLFRTGLAASHHHLSSTGAASYASATWEAPYRTASLRYGAAVAAAVPRAPLLPPCRVCPLPAFGSAGAAAAAAEAALGA